MNKSFRITMTHVHLENILYRWPFWALGVVIFFMSPLFAVVLSWIVYLKEGSSKSTFVLSPTFCISLTLALVNSGKVAEGDLIAYLEYFKQLEGMSLTEVLSLYAREPVFYGLAWIFGHLFSFSDFTFKFLFSFIGFYSLSFALKKIMLNLSYSKKKILLGTLLIALSTTVFANSLHLLRQFLSLAFFMLAFSSRSSIWKYLGFLVAVLTHMSTVFLIAFYFITTTKKISKLLFFLGLVFYKKVISAIVFLAISLGLAPLVYFASRVSSKTFNDMPGLSVSALIFLVVTLAYIILFLVIKRKSYDQDGHQSIPVLLNRFYQVNIYIGFSVLFIQFILDLNEPAARLMFSYVTLTMISIAFSLKFFRVNLLWLGLGSSILLVNFGFSLVYGTWTYDNMDQVLGCFLICRNL